MISAAGGELLFVEASRSPAGRGALITTGTLGDVMTESIKLALSWIRANAADVAAKAGFSRRELHRAVVAAAKVGAGNLKAHLTEYDSHAQRLPEALEEAARGGAEEAFRAELGRCERYDHLER